MDTMWDDEWKRCKKQFDDAGVVWTPFPKEDREKLIEAYKELVWPKAEKLIDKRGRASGKQIIEDLVALSEKYGVKVR